MAGRNTGGRSSITRRPCSTRFNSNEVKISERTWTTPAGCTPKAALVLIHGGMWHSGWFGELGDLLSTSNFAIHVSAPDQIAHGLSDDAIEGYRGYVPDFAQYAEEVREAVACARRATPDGTPVFLLGESMGGLCVLHHLVLHENDVDGIILCGAVLEVAPALLPPPFALPLLKGLAWVWPTCPVPGESVGGDTFDRAFGDPAVGPVARQDPLVLDKSPFRLGFMTTLMNAMDLVKRRAREKVKVKSVLMMHYRDDERIVYEACKSLVDTIPTDDKVYVTLEGIHHQVFQDTPTNSRQNAETVARFILERSG